MADFRNVIHNDLDRQDITQGELDKLYSAISTDNRQISFLEFLRGYSLIEAKIGPFPFEKLSHFIPKEFKAVPR
jgi:hypothetical protein